jgi:cyclophilin family peptidyl-prolyl cis-trans isomerase/HEAT repeat protein
VNRRVASTLTASLVLVMWSCGERKPPATPTPAPPVITVDQKMGRILRLEQQRILRDPAVGAEQGTAADGADLLLLARDGDIHVKRRAMLALGRVGHPDGAPVLVAALRDADEYTRDASAFALGLLGLQANVPVLVTALTDPAARVRGRAADALGLIGDAGAASAIAEMASNCGGRLAAIAPDDEEWPKSPEIESCRLALFALVRLKQYDALARVALDAQGQPVSQWWPVAYALQRIGDPRAAPALMSLAGGSGTYTRAFAIRGLAGAAERRVLPTASKLAADASVDVRVRVAAVRALAQLQSRSDLPVLLAIVRDRATPPNLALEAMTAIGALGDSQAFDDVLALWTHPWPAMRAAAITAAAKVKPDGFVLVVSSLMPDPDWSVRASLAGVFATLSPDQVRGAIEDLCDDPDVRVQGPALEALAQVGSPSLMTRVNAALEAPDVALRATAARVLADKKVPDGVARLTAAYDRGLRDAPYSARSAALDGLSKYGTDEAKAVIRRALDDPDWAMRIKAADLLHAMGDTAAAPMTPAPLRIPASTLASPALLHPPFSPHAFLDTRHGPIEIELNINDAPLSTYSFIERARAGFFNGMPVHRLVPNFVIQTGDPRGDGEGGPGYTIRDELSPLPYLRGTVGMALEWRETGGSQFFITVSPQPHLDAKYTVFGRVVSGQSILDRVLQGDVIERVRIWDGTR